MAKRVIIIIFIFGALLPGLHATPLNIVALHLNGNAKPYRILPDPVHDEYWIVNSALGLICLYETQPNQWTTEYFPMEATADAVGPNSNGYLYVSVAGDCPSIKTFDTTSKAFISSTPLQVYPEGLTFSSDQQHLYICALTWPLLGGKCFLV